MKGLLQLIIIYGAIFALSWVLTTTPLLGFINSFGGGVLSALVGIATMLPPVIIICYISYFLTED